MIDDRDIWAAALVITGAAMPAVAASPLPPAFTLIVFEDSGAACVRGPAADPCIVRSTIELGYFADQEACEEAGARIAKAAPKEKTVNWKCVAGPPLAP